MPRFYYPSLPLTLCFLLFPFTHVNANDVFLLKPYQRTLMVSAYTRPIQQMKVTSEVSGLCQKVFMDIGEIVPSDGIIAQIDTTFTELDLADNSLAQQLTQRQIELEQKTYDRYITLLSKESTPQATLDDASLKLDINRLHLKKLRNQENRLNELKKRHTLTGPSGWKVMQRFKEPDEYINRGDPVFQLGDFNQLLVSLALTYTELHNLQEQKLISLYLPDINTTIPGKIHRTAPNFDPKTRKIHTEISFEGKNPLVKDGLRGGMRVEIKIPGPQQPDTYLVPVSSLLNRYNAYYLMTPDKETTKVLLLGKSDDGHNAIVSSKHVSRGQSYLRVPHP